MIHSVVLLWLSALSTEALHQATDAEDGHHDQEDNEHDPGGGGDDIW